MENHTAPLLAAESLFEHAACGLLVTETNGTFKQVNATFCGWVGCEAGELIGKRRIQDLLTIGGRVFHQTHWAPLLQMQGSIAEVQLDMLDRAGEKIPMLFNAVRRRHGDIVYDEIAVFVATDRRKYERELLLARKNAEAALLTLRDTQQKLSIADRRKDEFLATLAHELRNPLAPMRNVLEILKLKEIDDPQSRWALDVFDRQVQHITHLVDDLMEVSRITQGKLELRRQLLDLAPILQGAVEATRSLIEKSAHELHVIFPSEPLVVNGDATRLVQIILNLLTNAAKYTPNGGKIWLRGERDGNEVVIAVRDSGIGIPPENLSGVFEMFSQLAPALERAQGGLGIGLALVRGLTELHGGTVAAYSEGSGHGSEFVVRLPLAETPAQENPVAGKTMPTAQPGQRVLVVDDNVDAAESLSAILEMLGYEVRYANDGLAGFRLAAEFLPDAILLDIGLPTINGYEIARLIRAEPWGKKMYLVAATGWGQAQDKQAALDAGFDRHLTKPIDFEQLEVVFNAMSAPRSSWNLS